MQFLVDNLQFYLQVDVPRRTALHPRVQNQAGQSPSRQFSTLIGSVYLATLSERCFLHARVIHRSFRTVFELCTDFCNLVSFQGRGPFQAPELRRIQALAREFKLQSTFLFSMLAQSTGQSASNLHLQQLILRIDYNRSYTREAMAGASSSLGAVGTAAGRR
eukprot:jgi/Bigna1/66800/fgenesh1_pg.2_\